MKIKNTKFSVILLVLVMICTLNVNLINSKAQTTEGDTLIFATVTPGQFTDVDPTVAKYTRIHSEYTQNVMETLFGRENNDASGDLTYVLAESYVQHNATTINVTLRDDVLFHDGTPFNASAAKWNFDRLYSIVGSSNPLWNLHNNSIFVPIDPYRDYFTAEWNYSSSPAGSYFPVIKQTTVIDEFTLQIQGGAREFSAGDDLLASGFCGMISPSFYADYADKPFWVHDNLTATGPYILGEHTPEIGHLYRFDDYYLGPANISEIIFSFVEDQSSAENALLTGQVDYLRVESGVSDFDALNASNIINLINLGLSGSQIVAILNNDRISQPVRKALSYAVDYEGLVQVGLEGLGSPGGGPISKGSQYYNPALEHPNLNLEIARQTMIDTFPTETAGLTNETTPAMNAQWENLADTAPLFNHTFIRSVTWDTIAVFVEDAARTVGGLIESDVQVSGDIVAQIIDLNLRALMDMYVVGYGDQGDPASYMQPAWDSSSWYNFANFSDPDIDKWIWEVDLLSDAGGARQSMFDNITTKIQSEYPLLFFYQRPSFAALSCKFQGNPTWTAAYFYNIVYDPDCPPAVPPAIPGYPTLLVLSFTAIAVIFLLRRKKIN